MKISKKSSKKIYKNLGIFVLVFNLLISTVACKTDDTGVSGENFGDFGADSAVEIANQFPFRYAYSESENNLAEWIINQIKSLGYEPQEQAVQGSGGNGRNIIVSIHGSGFRREQTAATDVAGAFDETAQIGDFARRIIIGAHYDTKLSEANKGEAVNFDGISDNASGVATLLSLLKNLAKTNLGFDVDIVFFTGSSDNFKGARTYLDSLSDEVRNQIESVIVVESILAGDNLYANAGINSVDFNNRYRLRVPLYDLLNISVSYYTGLRLLDNQGGYEVEVPGINDKQIYREFTLKKADHSPFDEAGLPVVYIESANYLTKSLNITLENQMPLFDSTKGVIRGTNYDNYELLKDALPEGMLKLRINALTFILKTYIESGLFNAEVR